MIYQLILKYCQNHGYRYVISILSSLWDRFNYLLVGPNLNVIHCWTSDGSFTKFYVTNRSHTSISIDCAHQIKSYLSEYLFLLVLHHKIHFTSQKNNLAKKAGGNDANRTISYNRPNCSRPAQRFALFETPYPTPNPPNSRPIPSTYTHPPPCPTTHQNHIIPKTWHTYKLTHLLTN